MPLDPRLVEPLARLTATRPDPAMTAAERRAAGEVFSEAIRPRIITTGPEMEVRDVVFDIGSAHIPVRIYRPAPGGLPALIYVHGGGFWSGSLDDADPLCRKRAAAIGCVVISIGYRLAPEHAFPTGLEDAWQATRMIVESAGRFGIDPRRIAIGGASAGGNLAAVIAQRARDAGAPSFAAQLLEIPVTDAITEGGSIDEMADGFGFQRDDLVWMWEQYLPANANRADPAVSPLRGRLAGLPPAVITTAEYDPFRDQAEQYAHALAEAGVDVVLRRWDGLPHGAADLDLLLPDIAEDYLEQTAAAVRRFLGASACGESDA